MKIAFEFKKPVYKADKHVFDRGGVAPTLMAKRANRINLAEGERVRRLTPRECFRLQGWTDDYFEKAQFVNSDSQLYKQAGNGVTVTVIQAIGEALRGEQE